MKINFETITFEWGIVVNGKNIQYFNKALQSYQIWKFKHRPRVSRYVSDVTRPIIQNYIIQKSKDRSVTISLSFLNTLFALDKKCNLLLPTNNLDRVRSKKIDFHSAIIELRNQ